MPLFDTTSIIFSGSQGTTNNTTPVVIVPDPDSNARYYIVDSENISVLNRDTAIATIILAITGPSTIIETVSMQPGDKWTNASKIVIGTGQTLTLSLSAAATTSQLTYNTVFYQIND